MLGSRTIRIIAALFLCTAVVALLWPRATGYVSTFAVVNAPILTVRAPINGVIMTPSPGLAAPVRRDETLLELRAPQTSHGEVSRLKAEFAVEEARARALAMQEREARAVVDALYDRVARETENEIVYLTRKLEQARADRQLNEVAWDKAQNEVERLRDLFDRGRIAATDLSAAAYARQTAEAELAADDAEIAALKVEIAAIENGLPSPAGTGRRDYAYDRIDDMELALADIRTRRIASEARRDAVRDQLASLTEELSGLTRFRPAASTRGVIWTASRQAGASVTLGSDLFQVLDCERRFLEVFFEERAFENLPPGTPARVRLRGSQRSFEATVASRHAAARGAAQSAVDAALLEPHEAGGVKVFLSLDPADTDDPEVAAAFCDVGRTAEVHVRHERVSGLFGSLFGRLSDLANGSRNLLLAETD